MEHFFNNAGPSVADQNYLIDPLQRIDVTHIEALIAQRRYFVLHAPRQTGKTTCLLALMDHLKRATMGKLAIDQPTYAGYQTAQTNGWPEEG